MRMWFCRSAFGPGPSNPGGITNGVLLNGSAGPMFGSMSPKKNRVTTNIVSVAHPTRGSVARLRNLREIATR
jgi:hypothetical protein